MVKIMNTRWHFFLTTILCCFVVQVYAKQPVTITAIKQLKEYESNALLADKKYKGKVIKVRGIVESIENNDATGDPNIIFTATTGYNGVRAEFSKKYLDTLLKIKKGDSVTVTCIGNGSLLGIVDLNCNKENGKQDAGIKNQ